MRMIHSMERCNRRSLSAYGLIVMEHSILDQEPRLSGDAFVVPCAAAERILLYAIGLDVHQPRTILELADHLFRWCHEAGACIIGFVTARTVELGWMTNRFMNGEPQIRGIENEIVTADVH